MTRSYRAPLAALVVLLLLPALAGLLLAVGEGRIIGTVVDDAGNPLPGVKVTITKPDSARYRQEKTTDKKGQFTVLILDATATYTFTLEKEGFAALEAPIKPQLGDTMRQTFTLARSAGSAAPAAGEGATPEAVRAAQAIPFFNEGVVAFNGRDMATAGEKFRQALELDPKLAPARAALAEVYIDQKKWAEALAEVDRYLELEPGNVRGLKDRYDILKELGGDKARTEAALAALVAAAPDRDTAVRIFNLGAESSRAGDLDTAVAHLKRALEIDPSLDPAYPALAGIHLKRKEYKEAVAVADRQLARDPANLEALTMRYEAFRAMGDTAKAKEAQAAMKAASEGGSPETLFKQGVALFNTNNTDQAKAAFERVLKLDPNHAKAHYLLGISQANTGENGPAKEHLKRFLELAPTDTDAEAAKQMLDYLK
jgi:Tfp pilus assembly protein PilF